MLIGGAVKAYWYCENRKSIKRAFLVVSKCAAFAFIDWPRFHFQ
jgi:hypothetical protein